MIGTQGIRWTLFRPVVARALAAWVAVLAAGWGAGCDRSGAGPSDAARGDEKKPTSNPSAGREGGGKGEAQSHPVEVRLNGDAVQKNGIRVDKASKRVLTPTVNAPARVSFNIEQTSHVGVPVTGRAIDIKVRQGDLVKKGDVLLVVDSPDLGEAQNDYLQRRTTLEIAGPAVELAQSAYQRANTLLQESQGIPLTEVQKRLGELQAAKGALRTAQAAVVAAENKLHLLGMTQEEITRLASSTEINPKFDARAPISGQVVEREVTLGELVRPDRESLLVLADLSTLWVIADVPRANVAELKQGAVARVFVASDSKPIEGTVTYISPRIELSQLAQVRIEVRGDIGGLRAGQFVTAELELSGGAQPEPVLAVPEAAIQTVEGATVVFVPVEGEPNTFAKRQVRIGLAVGGWVPVEAGLKEGDALVVGNSFILKADLGKSGAEED